MRWWEQSRWSPGVGWSRVGGAHALVGAEFVEPKRWLIRNLTDNELFAKKWTYTIN